MHIPTTFLVVVACASAVSSAISNQTRPLSNATTTLSSTPTTTSLDTSANPSQTGACAEIDVALQSYSAANLNSTRPLKFPASWASNCLKSVPLNASLSSAFVDYVEPYLQFQSTLAYLKEPPIGYTLPGVDILGGLAQIKSNLETFMYDSQWDFEVDLWSLVNVLPHDFHMNLPLPLLNVFGFFPSTGPLVSVSRNGLTNPNVYFKTDLDQVESSDTLSWAPSAVVSVNGADVTEFLNFLSQTTSPYQDPDANYNQVFYSLPSVSYNSDSLGIYTSAAFIFGFTNDTYTYQFSNGSVSSFDNFAVLSPSLDFTGVDSGQALFDLVDLPPMTGASATAAATTSSSSIPMATSSATATTVTSLAGYPSPVVMHSEGYTSGYFLDNTTTAVLAVQGFTDTAEQASADTEQQAVVRNFLAECRKAGMTRLIIDLQGNGGGDVFVAYDMFKQLFPSLEPFGASRMRATPLVNYFGTIFSADNIYNTTYNSEFQTQAGLDVNDNAFTSWNAEDGPYLIHGDNFTAEVRYNLSDPITEEIASSAMNVSGYLTNSKIAPQLFEPENIVMVFDGACGSTCAVFAEFMKSQANVRSVTLGGRPQFGPMQGVAGSKGAQVETYGDMMLYWLTIPDALSIYESKSLPAPDLPPADYLLDASDPPLGTWDSLKSGARFNLRNNMHDGDETQTPLQFIYEASNCRLFYTAADIYDISNVWSRVANVVWGNGFCVPGSSIELDDTFPNGAYDTVPFSPLVMSTVVQPPQPGLLQAVVLAPAGGDNDPSNNPSNNVTSFSNSTLANRSTRINRLRKLASTVEYESLK